MGLAYCESSSRVTADLVSFVVDFYRDDGVAGERADQGAVVAYSGSTEFACISLVYDIS